MKKLLLSGLLGIFGLCFPASLRAQFIGYTTPQSVQQRMLNAVTVPTTAIVPNLGQSVHSLTYTAVSCTGVDIRLEASNDGVNFFAISADATDTAPNPIGGVTGTGGVTAVGYYPVVRVNLLTVIGGACSVTAFYAGTSTIQPTPTQINQQAAGYRFPVTSNTVTSNAFTTIALPTPFGNSRGSLWIQCSAACAAGGVVTIFASPADTTPIGSTSITTASVRTITGLQKFDVPGFSTNRVFVGITPTAASANTWTIVYNFWQPGLDPFLANDLVGSSEAQSAYPVSCDNYSPISTTASVVLKSGLANKNIHVCSITLVPAAADNVAIVEGTGATCGTGTTGVVGGSTAATGLNLLAGAVYAPGSGFGQIFQTAVAGNDLCVLVSAATQLSGGFSWSIF